LNGISAELRLIEEGAIEIDEQTFNVLPGDRKKISV
jgi:hypothetical protein